MNEPETINLFDSQEIDFTSIFKALEQTPYQAPAMCSLLSNSDWSLLLESLTNEQRLIVWPTIPRKKRGNVLARMRDDSRAQILKLLSEQKIQQTLRATASSDAVEILGVLPNKKASNIINKLSPELQQSLGTSLTFDDDQIGRYSNPDVFTVLASESVQEVINEIVENGLPQSTDSLVVVDEENSYRGIVLIEHLLATEHEVLIEQLLIQSSAILATVSLLEASNILKNSNRSMLPIITDKGELIGRISLNDALTIFQEYYEGQILHLGKVNDEDLFAPTIVSARRRAVWLGINLLTALIASVVIGIFDEVIAEVVALAVLMPIVASMGGITGSQTLTLTIRGLATGQLSSANMKALRNKELHVSILNGIGWALVVAFLTGYWFDNYSLSAIIAVALIVNMAVAALSGIFIPIILQKMNIDPALAGSVILTTVTDVVGFFVFLGSATLLFLS